MANDFDGKRVLNTGAKGELDHAAPAAFAAAGARLALLVKSAERLEKAFPSPGEAVHLAAVDLLDFGAVESTCREVHSRFGGIDVAFHTVGGLRGGKSVVDEESSKRDLLLNLDLRGARDLSSRRTGDGPSGKRHDRAHRGPRGLDLSCRSLRRECMPGP